MQNNGLNSALVLGTMVAFGVLALLGVLLVQAGPESTQRLGLLFGILATGVAALAALLKATQAQQNTNGKLDARIEAAVHRAQNARRRGDRPLTTAEVDGLPPSPVEADPRVDP